MLAAILINPHWFWLSLGGVLLAAEMLGASGYLLWSGIAAILVGLLVWVFPLGWDWQGLIFALLTMVLAYLWWYRLRSLDAKRPASTLNQRGEQLIGVRLTLEVGLINRVGRLRIGDGTWRAQATQDLAAGSRVEVYAIEGITLLIRPVAAQS